MELQIDRKSFLKAIKTVAPAVNNKRDCLGMIYFECQNRQMIVRGLNRLFGIEYRFSSFLFEKQSVKFMLPRNIIKLISQLNSTIIYLEIGQKDNNFTHQIKTLESRTMNIGLTKTKVKGLDPDLYPKVFERNLEKNYFHMPIDIFLIAYEKLKDIANRDKLGKGINIAGKAEPFQKLYLASNDGHQLAWIVVNSNIAEVQHFLEPKTFDVKVINQVIKIARNKSQKTVQLSFEESPTLKEKVLFFDIGDNCSVFSYLIKNQYPCYEEIIPNSFDNIVVFNKKDLLSKLQDINTDNTATFDLTLISNKIEIEAKTHDAETVGNTSIDCCLIKSETTHLIFDSKYLLNAINFLDSKSISINYKKDSRMVVFKNHSCEAYQLMPNFDCNYLIMPIIRQY